MPMFSSKAITAAGEDTDGTALGLLVVVVVAVWTAVAPNWAGGALLSVGLEAAGQAF